MGTRDPRRPVWRSVRDLESGETILMSSVEPDGMIKHREYEILSCVWVGTTALFGVSEIWISPLQLDLDGWVQRLEDPTEGN